MAQAQGTPISGSSLVAEPRDRSSDAVIGFGRSACIAALGGLIVGLPMGVLNRVVMRIVAVMNGPTPFETDFGAKVLNFTPEGTTFLIVSTTIFAIVPALLYVGLRRLLPGGVLVGGLAFGVILAAVYATVIVDSLAHDFRFLGEPMVSAAMFVGLFVLFGLLIAPVVTWVDRRFSRDVSDGIAALYAIVGGLIALVAATGLFRGNWSWLLVVPLGYAMAISAGERTGARWVAQRRRIGAVGFLTLALPLALGLADLADELTLIAKA